MSRLINAVFEPVRSALDLLFALRQLTVPLAFVVVITAIGTAGYVFLLDLSVLDGLYQSVITLSTVGFEELAPFTPAAKLFTIVLVFTGVGAVFYAITLLAATVVDGEVRRSYRRRLMARRVNTMRNHYIVCGYGRVGEEIARMFRVRHRDFVVVDKDEATGHRAEENGCQVMVGNAEDEAVLRLAGIERATGLIAATTSDAINTYVVLTARSLNPDVYIVARSEASSSQPKLELAGANRIISPYAIGARRMALSSLQPMMADFMDALAVGRHGEMLIAEIAVEPDSPLDGVTLGTAFTKDAETTVLGIRRADKSFLLGPRGGARIDAGDVVILMAAESDLARFAERGKGS